MCGSLSYVTWYSNHSMLIISNLFFKSSLEDMFIDFRGRERGRESGGCKREKYWCERETVIGCDQNGPDQELKPQPRCVPWLGIEPATFLYVGPCSNQPSHSSRTLSVSFINYFNLYANTGICWYSINRFPIHIRNIYWMPTVWEALCLLSLRRNT